MPTFYLKSESAKKIVATLMIVSFSVQTLPLVALAEEAGSPVAATAPVEAVTAPVESVTPAPAPTPAPILSDTPIAPVEIVTPVPETPVTNPDPVVLVETPVTITEPAGAADNKINTPSGLATIDISAPNGGETFTVGNTVIINWQDASTTAIAYDVLLVKTKDGMNTQSLLSPSVAAKSYSWVIPSAVGETQIETGAYYRIKVCPAASTPCDQSDNLFTITNPSLPMAGGELWYASLFDYSATHPDMNIAGPGELWTASKVTTDPLSASWDRDWYTAQYAKGSRYFGDLSSQYATDFFPLDNLGADDPTGVSNHNFHFGAHLVAAATVAVEGDYNYYLRSDDDAFLYFNNVLAKNNSGLDPMHPAQTGSVHLKPGEYKRIDLFFAERHSFQSGLEFRFTDPGVNIIVCRDGVCPVPGNNFPPSQPVITFPVPIPPTITASTSVTVRWTDSVTDSHGLKWYACLWDNASSTEPDKADSCGSATSSVRNLPVGTWWFHVRAVGGMMMSTTTHYGPFVVREGDKPDNEDKVAIRVTSPNGGEQWPLGSTKNVTWDRVDPAINKIKIDLIEYHECVTTPCPDVLPRSWTLVASTTNSGSWSWSIGQDLSTTTKYIIRITGYYPASDKTAQDESNAPFQLIDASPIGQRDIVPATLPGATKGQDYCQTLTTTGFTGTSSIYWTVTNGALPNGLSLSTTTTNGEAKICGRVDTVGTFNFAITARATDGQTASRAYTITISDNGGGGGGGGGSSSSGGGYIQPVPQVLGTSTAVCRPFIKKYIKFGEVNDAREVKKLQVFLVLFEKENLQVTGRYDRVTYEAVKRFQSKYGTGVLAPWGIDESTGYVYITTKAKINRLFCGNLKDARFGDLSADESYSTTGGDQKIAALELGPSATSSSSSPRNLLFASIGGLGFLKGASTFLFWLIIVLVALYLVWTTFFRPEDEDEDQSGASEVK